MQCHYVRTPIIGQRGVAALYRRSLFLCPPDCDGQPTLPGLPSFRISQGGVKIFAPSACHSPAPGALNARPLSARLRRNVARHSHRASVPQTASARRRFFQGLRAARPQQCLRGFAGGGEGCRRSADPGSGVAVRGWPRATCRRAPAPQWSGVC